MKDIIATYFKGCTSEDTPYFIYGIVFGNTLEDAPVFICNHACHIYCMGLGLKG